MYLVSIAVCSGGEAHMILLDTLLMEKDAANGIGLHAQAIDRARLDRFIKFNFSGEVLYPLCLSFIKSTILCMYLRIFGIDIIFRRITYIHLVIVWVWGICFSLAALFQCNPMRAAVDLALQEQPTTRCIHLPAYFLSMSVLNVVLDICILVLPLKPLWALSLATSRKLAISMIFLLGTL